MNCFECGTLGHRGKDCKNRKYLANKNWECGCDINELKQIDFNGPTKTHCCECKNTGRTLDMEWHPNDIGRMRCLKCKFGENYDPLRHERRHRNQTLERLEPRRRFERPSNFGKCINCEKQPTSSIQSVLENGLCRSCNDKKENFERY